MRKNKAQGTNVLIAAAVAMTALGSVQSAHAIAPIGDNSELFVTGTAGAQYDSNIFLSHSNEKNDYIFDLIPGLSYEFGKNNSLTSGQLAANEDFQLFAKKSSLNNDLFNGTFWTKYDDSKTTLNFDASFHQADQAERTIQNLGYLVNRDLSHIDALGETQVTEKSSVAAGVVWDDTDFKTAGFTDWRYWQIPVNYYFKVEPKLDLSAGFRYQENTLGAGGVDSQVYFYNVGARGEFTPNLTGKLQVGYIEQDLDRGGRQAALGADSSFTYSYSPKTSVTAGVNDDFGYAAVGSAYRDFGVYVGFNTSLNEQFSANGQVSYNRYTYTQTPQRDDFYSLKIGGTYTYSTNISFNATISYNTDNSNLAGDSFKATLLSVAAVLHY